ncbi:LpxL/LpxP family Kdo(2)-lipid IV(A) lauroyl/palmitoleoyl acyltransferase [Thalassotalea agariperforans]
MSSNKVLQPNFKLSYFLPKYWLTWLGVITLYTISWLPYRWQLWLGRMIGRLLYKLGYSRIKVAKRNLALCFPEKSEAERTALLKKNIENTGIALLETGMGWWWPDWRFKGKVTIEGIENIEKIKAQGQGVLILTMHYLSTEMNCRGAGAAEPMVVFYRPNNNALMEYFQFRGRNRANKYMLGKRDVKGLIKALKDGESCIYLPDQDYGRNKSLFIPFYGIDAATTTGTLIFAKQKNCQVLMMTPTRNDDDSGYTISFSKPWQNFPSGDDAADLLRVNQELEKAISYKPEQYMWVHRRFKTRENENDPSLYK